MTLLDTHQTLLQNLLTKTQWPHPVAQIQKIETHISSVLLTGEFAYKIKKPVDFGFVNFTTLASRQHFCEEEIRLNSRLAPQIYLNSVAITGSINHPQIDGRGEVIDYAVKMRQFDSRSLLDQRLKQHKLDTKSIIKLADKIADFHQHIAVADATCHFGNANDVLAPMQQNFDQIRQHISQRLLLEQLQRIESWTLARYQQLKDILQQRKAQGFIRECHGDMHLGNIALDGDELIIFDGIEFNDDFRWIDVISELAFISMDLTDKNATTLAASLINRYLEITGDYAGLRLLRFYQVYRAMVRAKVASLSGQPTQYASYANLAERFMTETQPKILLMYGLSASGKSTIASELAKRTIAIHIKSDRERKRLFAQRHPASHELNSGLYSRDITAQTYRHLLQLAQTIVGSGFSVIVDATFLQNAQRKPFEMLSQALGIDFKIIQLEATLEDLQQRLHLRRKQKDNISDATIEVIRHQQQNAQPPGEDEAVLKIDTALTVDYDSVIKLL